MDRVIRDDWAKLREAVGADGLAVIAPAGSAAAVRGALASHGLAGAEVVEPDAARYASRAASLLHAFERTTAGYVYVVDSDVVENVHRLPRFFAELVTKGADVVNGSKRHPESRTALPVRRRLLSWAYYAFVRRAIGLRITDTQTGVRLFRRETLRYALERTLSKDGAFDLELLAVAAGHGAKIAEAPVTLATAEGVSFARADRSFLKAAAVNTLAVFYRARLLGYYEKCLVPKRLDHEPLVSIVIACPRRSWMLDECLAAIRSQTYRRWEVLVLPDEAESGDAPVSAAGQSGDPQIRFLPTGKVRPAEKRNLGIRAAKGEIIAFIDDDAYPEAHWLEYAVKYFGEPSIGAVGGPGVTPPGDRSLAKIGGRVYDNILVSGNYRYRYRAGGVRRDVEDYPSCNLFVRRDILEEIGGYRTDFWPGEDTLLCKDIIDNWKRIIYEPWVIVYHHRRALFAPHLRQLGRYGFHRGYFCKRFPSNSLRLSYFIPTAFAVYCLTWLALACCPPPAAAPGWLTLLLRLYLIVPMGLYLALVLATTCCLNPVVWLLTAAGVFASHVVYGLRFAQGLCARKAPCEYIGKDHA